MDDIEVVDVAESIKNWPPCFGTFDEDHPDCTQKCELNSRCKSHKENAAKPPPAEVLESVEEEVPDMEPADYLVEYLKGRYDVAVKKDEKGMMVAARKNKKPVVMAVITTKGVCYIKVVPTNTQIQLGKLESCRQVLHIAKAILVV